MQETKKSNFLLNITMFDMQLGLQCKKKQ